MTYVLTLEIDDAEMCERCTDADDESPHGQVSILRDFGTVREYFHEDPSKPPSLAFTELSGTLEP
jgi:hypothetical protein